MLKETHAFDGISISGYADEYVFEQIKRKNAFYESHILEMWDSYIAPGDIVFDIGANLGNHTVFFSKKTPAKHIYAFEPLDINFKLLEENCDQNSCNNVSIFNVALGSKEEKACMVTDSVNLGKSFLSLDHPGDIEIKALDNFSEEVECPNFMKIDVEGFEMEVLKGMDIILKKAKPILWVEVSSKTVKSVCTHLKSYGYEILDFYHFNILLACSSEPVLSKESVIERHLIFIDKTWIEQEVRLEALQAKNNRINALISEIDLLKQKRNELLDALQKKKKDNEILNERLKKLLNDLDVNKNKNKQLLSLIDEKKTELLEYSDKMKKLNKEINSLKARNS